MESVPSTDSANVVRQTNDVRSGGLSKDTKVIEVLPVFNLLRQESLESEKARLRTGDDASMMFL